jgi:hypothetical protein
MSVLRLELKKEHILLLSKLSWSIKDNIVSGVKHDGEEYSTPYNGDILYEEIDTILNGIPDDFDPNTEEYKVYSDEQKAEWDKLYSELPMALSIILQRCSFELGNYKAKFHDQVWNKIG